MEGPALGKGGVWGVDPGSIPLRRAHPLILWSLPWEGGAKVVPGPRRLPVLPSLSSSRSRPRNPLCGTIQTCGSKSLNPAPPSRFDGFYASKTDGGQYLVNFGLFDYRTSEACPLYCHPVRFEGGGGPRGFRPKHPKSQAAPIRVLRRG